MSNEKEKRIAHLAETGTEDPAEGSVTDTLETVLPRHVGPGGLPMDPREQHLADNVNCIVAMEPLLGGSGGSGIEPGRELEEIVHLRRENARLRAELSRLQAILSEGANAPKGTKPDPKRSAASKRAWETIRRNKELRARALEIRS